MPTQDNQSEEQGILDEAPQPGGVYVKDGQVVDAEGKVLEGWTVDSKGNAVKAGRSAPRTAPKTEGQQ